MPGLVPGIHVFFGFTRTWMAGTSPAIHVCFDSDTDAITNSDLPIRTSGTSRGS